MPSVNPKTPKRPDWHAEDIKAAIRKTGLTLSMFAHRHGRSIAAIRKAFSKPCAPSQSLIADHLGLHPKEIWPSRYDESGQAIDRRRQRRPRNDRASAHAQRQNCEAQ